VPGRGDRKGGNTKSGAGACRAAAEIVIETLLNLLRAGARGRFSGTMFSSELARHGWHSLRSLHRRPRVHGHGVVAGGPGDGRPAPREGRAAVAITTHARRSPPDLRPIEIARTRVKPLSSLATAAGGHTMLQPILSYKWKVCTTG